MGLQRFTRWSSQIKLAKTEILDCQITMWEMAESNRNPPFFTVEVGGSKSPLLFDMLVVGPPLWNILVNWDDCSQYMRKCKKWQPNHQPVWYVGKSLRAKYNVSSWKITWFHRDFRPRHPRLVLSWTTAPSGAWCPRLSYVDLDLGQLWLIDDYCRCILNLSGWWLGHPSEKYESQLGWLFPIYAKMKNVPNHQPAIVDMAYKPACIWAKHHLAMMWTSIWTKQWVVLHWEMGQPWDLPN